MHELGILYEAMKSITKLAKQHGIKTVKTVTFSVGTESGVVPLYLERLFPVAIESYPVMHHASMNVEVIEGKGFFIKEIGYEHG